MSDISLPFGDPCPKCGAASSATDPRDRTCVCDPCEVCSKPTLSSCAICGRSLGCREHSVTIERHVETYCLASRDEHIRVADAGLSSEQLDVERDKLRANTPKPWPMPVPPWRTG